MCHFITATLPKGADVDALKDVFRENGFALGLESNAAIQSQLPSGAIYFRPTTAYCDCGTPLGSRSSRAKHAAKESPTEADVAKLRRKGWTQAKIDRWLAQKGEARQKNERAASQKETDGVADAKAWLRLLITTVESGHTPWVGLLLHFYKRSVSDEEFQVGRVVTARATDLSVDLLLDMDEDVLYRFER